MRKQTRLINKFLITLGLTIIVTSCSKPENIAKLAIACGIATSTVGYGGVLLWSSGASGGTTALPGLALIGGGALAAKKFCGAFVRYSTVQK